MKPNSVKTIKKTFVGKRKTKPRTFKKVSSDTVHEIVGELEQGSEIFGLTKGQISLIDILSYVLDTTGPAHISISTWTAAESSVTQALGFLNSGKILTMRLMIDPSFKARKPGFCKSLISIFGPDSIRSFRNHSKFILVKNDNWNISIRTSMNLNQNPRMESFDISTDAEMFHFLNSVVDEIFLKIPNDIMYSRNDMTNETLLDFTAPICDHGTSDMDDTFELDDLSNLELPYL